MEAIILALLGLVGMIAFFVGYGVLTWGLVTYKFYYWFFIVLVPAAPAITFAQAIMISCCLSLFKNHSTGHKIKKEYREDSGLTEMFLSPWVTLLLGWIVHSCL
jgi:hypothetical protein